tara:strand:- start:1150 stop:2883 length:1734 start_codon:yes stop_codon:yes gene_type:complete
MLQILVVFMAIMEIVGVASIIPFMALVGNMNQLQEETLIAQVYEASNIGSETQFLFLLGLCVMITLFIATSISTFTIWKICMFTNKIGAEISERLYTHYLKQDLLFHSSGSSAILINKIAIDTIRVTSAILLPLMNLNAKSILALLMVLSIFAFNPFVAIIIFTIFGISYSILFTFVRMRLLRNGRIITMVNEKRFRLMNEGFGGIKDVLLLGRDIDFINRFNETGNTLAKSLGTNDALASVPRYIMELVAFGSMIAVVLFLIVYYENNLGLILPILSVYALAGVKLLPAFQSIYTCIAKIRASTPAFESIEHDLINSKEIKYSPSVQKHTLIAPKKHISLENITFKYPDKEDKVLSEVNMLIPVNNVIGIVGPSGSGKSTLVDILLGLIKPQHGNLKIDGEVIDKKNCRSWQNSIGFVAQSIFLSEGSIAENVAFGIPHDQINLNKVHQALRLANLNELIDSLDEGIHTKVGERGVQLSGGQRQRIGIARALYYKSAVLVFDEATSSLDGISEKIIMEAINNFSGKKTIIMIAHRLSTVQKCDQIFFLDKGKVIDKGTYQELIETNEYFRNMAANA